MQATFRSAELLIRKGQTIALGDAARSVITGMRGAVWLTRDGDLTDRVLLPGQSLSVGPGAHVLLSVFEEGSVKVEQQATRSRGAFEQLARDARAAYLRYLRRLEGRHGRPVVRAY